MSETPVSSLAHRPLYSPRNPILRAVLVVLAAALIVIVQTVSRTLSIAAFAAAKFAEKQKSPKLT